VADFFCGLGNFSLALARRAREVVGIEGSQALTDQAMANARVHGLGERMSFSRLDLFRVDRVWLDSLGAFDRVLIDPPREGAQALSEALANQSLDGQGPSRIVMVSCNPATLARDAAILVHQGFYQLSQAGAVNMFPQTAHVESIAVFDRLPPMTNAL
jgi:23S rRNA (uracil1939-C5)-methyltransferase